MASKRRPSAAARIEQIVEVPDVYADVMQSLAPSDAAALARASTTFRGATPRAAARTGDVVQLCCRTPPSPLEHSEYVRRHVVAPVLALSPLARVTNSLQETTERGVARSYAARTYWYNNVSPALQLFTVLQVGAAAAPDEVRVRVDVTWIETRYGRVDMRSLGAVVTDDLGFTTTTTTGSSSVAVVAARATPDDAMRAVRDALLRAHDVVQLEASARADDAAARAFQDAPNEFSRKWREAAMEQARMSYELPAPDPATGMPVAPNAFMVMRRQADDAAAEYAYRVHRRAPLPEMQRGAMAWGASGTMLLPWFDDNQSQAPLEGTRLQLEPIALARIVLARGAACAGLSEAQRCGVLRCVAKAVLPLQRTLDRLDASQTGRKMRDESVQQARRQMRAASIDAFNQLYYLMSSRFVADDAEATAWNKA